MGASVTKRFAALLALVLSSFALAPGLAAPSSAADDYTSKTRTSCHVSVPSVVRIGDAPHIRVHVQPNGPAAATGPRGAARAARAERPTGSVTVGITRAGTSVFTRTVAYDGSPVTIVGPEIDQPGHYVVRAQFRTADGSVYRSCQGTTSFDVGDGGDNPDGTDPPGGNGGNETPGGILPDTGGPDLRWLMLGVALVLGGLGLVVASRDRRSAPYLV
jgi:hypothetical protein